MIWLALVGLFVLLCFGAVLFVGAPYVPTLSPQVVAALELADLKASDTLLELGCGDGKVVLAAVRLGYHVVGYELNPILAFVAWLRTRKYRQQVQIVWGDFWHKPWPPAEAVFVFLQPRYMTKLDRHIKAWPHKPVKLVSFAFQIPDRKPDKTQAGVFLYRYR